MPTVNERLAALRAAMKAAQIDFYYVPSVDPHQSEYVAECWQRRAWISGFGGSAGDLLVGSDWAGLWTDGRYFLQAERELAGSGIELFRQGLPKVPTLHRWLETRAAKGLDARGVSREPEETGKSGQGDAETPVDRPASPRSGRRPVEDFSHRHLVVGADPHVLSAKAEKELRAASTKAGAKLKLLGKNLVDSVWSERPALPDGPITVHPLKYAGESLARKLKRIRAELASKEASALVITTLDAIAWTFNLRGSDVPHNPVAIAYAIITSETATLYCDPQKVSAALEKALGRQVILRPYDQLKAGLAELNRADERVWVDPETVNAWVLAKLGKAQLVEAASPIVAMKARKNQVELAGAQQAHIRDGVAVVRFLAWLDEAVAAGELTELSASDYLAALRAEGEHYRGESFGPISGYRGHGAIVHYSASAESASRLRARGLYLIDSGGQYTDGTTDITRTVLLGGKASAEQSDRFTRVLKGHIAIARAIFPAGTPGRNIDAFARRALWEVGLDYAHGTGHGVGSFLGVHEGPIAISPTRCVGAPLEEGQIVSNEPGYYKAGEYGIRIENLLVVQRHEALSSDSATFLCFRELTLCPIDQRLIKTSLLSREELSWLNSYHQRVRESLAPLLDRKTLAWLRAATRRLRAD